LLTRTYVITFHSVEILHLLKKKWINLSGVEWKVLNLRNNQIFWYELELCSWKNLRRRRTSICFLATE